MIYLIIYLFLVLGFCLGLVFFALFTISKRSSEDYYKEEGSYSDSITNEEYYNS